MSNFALLPNSTEFTTSNTTFDTDTTTTTPIMNLKHDKSEQTDITTDEFELDDCLLESNDIVITQNKDGFVLHVKKLGNVTSSKLATTDDENQDQQQQQQQQHIQHQSQHHQQQQSHHQQHHQDQSHSHHPQHHHHHHQQQQQQHHHHQQLHHHLQLATPTNVVAVPGVHQLTSDDNQGKTLTSLHPIKLPSAECELINLKKIQPTTSAIATTAIIPPQHLQEHHTNIVTTNPQTLNTILGIREVNIQQKNLGSRIKYRGKYSTSPVHDSDGTVQLLATISPKQEIGPTTTTVMAGEKKFEIAEITDLNTPQASIISDLVKYAEIDDIELPDGTKIGIGYAPTEISEHHIQTAQTVQQVQQVTDSPSHEIIQHDRNGAPGQESTITKSYTILTTTPIKQTQQPQHQQHQQQVTTQHQIQQHHQAQQQIQIQQQSQQQQQQHTTTTTTTTYELSLSDSSLTQSEDNEKLYVCRHCGKKYRWKSTLRRHENVECGGKEPCHPCPYCTYKAKQRGNLGVHVRKHHPEKPQLESIRGRKSV